MQNLLELNFGEVPIIKRRDIKVYNFDRPIIGDISCMHIKKR